MTLPFALSISTSMSPVYALHQLAEKHGYSSVKVMLSAHRLRLNSTKEDRLVSYSVLISKLTGKRIVWSDLDGYQYDKNRYFRSLVAPYYKACPICIRQKVSNFSHRYITSSYCFEHKCALIDRCQKCLKPYEVSSQALNGNCPDCCYPIEMISSTAPAHDKLINQVENRQRAAVLLDLCSAAGLILRPFDSVPSRIRSTQVYDTGLLFKEAFKLLTSNTVRTKWIARATLNRQSEFSFLGKSGIEAGLNSVMNNLRYDWSSISISENSSLTEQDAAIVEEHDASKFTTLSALPVRKLPPEQFNVYSRFKTTPKQLAEILGLPPKATIELMKKDILERSAKTNAYVYNQFDLRHIDKLLALTSKDTSGMVKIPFKEKGDRVNALLFSLGSNIEFVVEEAIKGTKLCRVAHGQMQFCERIYCKKIGFLKFLMTKFIKDKKRKIIKSEAMNLFGLTDGDLRSLQIKKILTAIPHMHVYEYFYLEDLLNIDNNLFNLGRYCKLRNLSFDNVAGKLKQVGIKPIIGRSIYQCRQQIIRFLRHGEFQPAKSKNAFHLKTSFFPF